MQHNTARVWILDALYHMDKGYDYHIPPDLRGKVLPGGLVFIPFGNANKSRVGLVESTFDLPADSLDKLKPIFNLHDNSEAKLSTELLALCHYIKDTTFCTMGDIVRCALPFGLSFSVDEIYAPHPNANREELNANTLVIFDFVKLKGKVTVVEIAKQFGNESVGVLRSLTEAGILVRKYKTSDKAKSQFAEQLELTPFALGEQIAAKIKLRSAVQQQIFDHLLAHGKTEAAELRSLYSATAAHIKGLVAKDYVTVTSEDIFRSPLVDAQIQTGKTATLSPEQQSASDVLRSLYDTGEAKAALLHGVTGSGKTHVMLDTIRHVVDSGRSVIVLVPEISLTPQTVAHFTREFGKNIAVLHSSLSSGERYDQWRLIAQGKVQICIGTRSAVFAPFENLGLIIIDEEQEHTYKSDMSPHYHARDAARFRCAKNNALMLLCSATPSVESYHKATTGAYTLVELTQRYGNATLPEAVIADMRGCVPSDIVGETLSAELEANLARGEQSVLFVNRRGFNTLVTCVSCSTAVTCHRCSVSLTYHLKSPRRRNYLPGEDVSPDERARRDGYLCCHYCGERSNVPQNCTSCKSEHLQFLGFGTQMAAEKLQTLYPNASLVRIDADTTTAKHAFAEMLTKFREDNVDIMLGTQMVTKGHDFPNVTLVGILLADTSLYLDDYRANERTFGLVTQVIGRAGRAGPGGRAVIQTYSPEHRILELAKNQDYKAFFADEIAFRRALLFPPFCDVVMVTLSSIDESDLRNVTTEFNKRLHQLHRSEYADIALIVFGPHEAAVYKINDRYRMRFILKCKMADRRTRELFNALLVEFGRKTAKKIGLSIDVNPNNI